MAEHARFESQAESNPPQYQSQRIYPIQQAPELHASAIPQYAELVPSAPLDPSIAMPKKEDRFKETAKYNDVWATVAFGAMMASFAVYSGFGYSSLRIQSNPSGLSQLLAKHVGGLIVSSVAVGGLLSFGYFMLVRMFAGKLILTTLVLTVLFNIGLGAYFAIGAVYPAAAFFLIFGAVQAWIFWSWRAKIPFTKALLKNVTDVTVHFPATIAVALIGLIVQVGFSIFWVFGFIGFLSYSIQRNMDYRVIIATYFYALFCLYWTSQVIKNAVHMTISGLVASYYFLGIADQTGKVTVSVHNPTVASAKRALTTSFGSNCFSSLLISVAQTLLSLTRSSTGGRGCLGFLCACFVPLIEALVQLFNKFSLSYVAIYGQSYLLAAKSTWNMMKNRGIDAIVNDIIIHKVFRIGSFFIAALTCLSSVAYVAIFKELSDSNDRYYVYILFGIIAVFIGFLEFHVVMQVLDSGVTTTFVCLAEDPEALLRTKPKLYEKIVESYPQAKLPVSGLQQTA